MSEALQILFIVLAFAIVFPLFWMTITLFTGVISGWQGLAGEYRTDFPAEVELLRMQSGRARTIAYNGILSVGATQSDLHLRVLFFYRAGHPPLLIPISDVIHAQEERFFIQRLVHLKFEKKPNLSFKITKRAADYLVEQSHGAFSYTPLQN